MMIALAAMVMELKNVISVMVKVSISMAMNVLAAMVEVKRTAFFAVEEERQNVAMVEDIGYVMIVTETAK